MSHFQQQISNLLKSKEFWDVILIVGQDKIRFQSHKLLLSLSSDVFKAMLYGPMAEENSEIILPEDNARSFQVFLTYIYTNKLEVKTVKEAILALFFSDKYVINPMKEDTLSYLEEHLSVDCAIEVYEAAVMLEQSRLISISNKYINKNISTIINHENFSTAKLETVLDIISKDILSLDSELQVYKAIVKWGKHQENNHLNLREKIFPLLKEVRFISMSYLEFSGAPCEDEILTKDEKLEIFIQKSNPDKENSNNIQKQWKKERIFQILSSCYLSSKFNNDLDLCVIVDNFPTLKERFRSTQYDLNVWGVSIEISVKLRSTENANVTLCLNVNNLTKGSKKHNIVEVPVKESEDFMEAEIINVRLKEPVSVMKGEQCEISLEFYNSNQVYRRVTFCKNKNHSYNILNSEIISDYDNKNQPHFSAILVSYSFRKQLEISKIEPVSFPFVFFGN